MTAHIQSRNEYIDLCKFFAMFVVTWEHFAQGFSHESFPDFFGGVWYGIAFEMPLFMLCSGWFMNTHKIKSQPLKEYVKSRFSRLVLPGIAYYLVCCLLIWRIPNPYHAFVFYWYLTSLFVCQMIIAIASKFTSRTSTIILILSLVTLIPFTDFLKINFMLPFLLGGVILKYLFDNNISLKCLGFVSFIVTGFLLYFWNVDYSVYKSPFNSINMNIRELGIYVYRFSLGFSMSILFVVIAKYLTRYNLFKNLARLGKYTLVMYTVSVICKYVLINNTQCVVTEPIYLEITSLIATVFLIALSVVLTKLFEKNKITSFLLLGQYKLL